MLKLVDVDRRKNVAVFELEGALKCISVELDATGNPLLDSKTEAELERLFTEEKPVEIPNTPYARSVPVTKIRIEERRAS